MLASAQIVDPAKKDERKPVYITVTPDNRLALLVTRAVRKRAAQILGELGPGAKEAVPALLQSLRDRENAVRDAAAAALKQIDPKAAAKAGVR